MGATISFTAALKKGDQVDRLVLTNGEEINLPSSLPYADGESLVVHVMSRNHQDDTDGNLAKQILQEILDGE